MYFRFRYWYLPIPNWDVGKSFSCAAFQPFLVFLDVNTRLFYKSHFQYGNVNTFICVLWWAQFIVTLSCFENGNIFKHFMTSYFFFLWKIIMIVWKICDCWLIGLERWLKVVCPINPGKICIPFPSETAWEVYVMDKLRVRPGGSGSRSSQGQRHFSVTFTGPFRQKYYRPSYCFSEMYIPFLKRDRLGLWETPS